MSAPVLAHYDPSLPLKLAADASAYGVGAVISHTYDNGIECPITFASRTLSAAEKNYSQIDKEALALVFGVQKFHPYLYGSKFVLVTDHKPFWSPSWAPRKPSSGSTPAALGHSAVCLLL